MTRYNFKIVEKKWQDFWDSKNLFKANNLSEELFYTFSYPSLYLAAINFGFIPGNPPRIIAQYRGLLKLMKVLDLAKLGNDMVFVGNKK